MPVFALSSGFFFLFQSLRLLLRFFQLLFRLLPADEPPCLGQLPAPGGVLPGSSICLRASLPHALNGGFPGDDDCADDHQDHNHHIGARGPYGGHEDSCHRSPEQSSLLQEELEKGSDKDKQQDGRPRFNIGRPVAPVGYEKCHRSKQQEGDKICTVPEKVRQKG